MHNIDLSGIRKIVIFDNHSIPKKFRRKLLYCDIIRSNFVFKPLVFGSSSYKSKNSYLIKVSDKIHLWGLGEIEYAYVKKNGYAIQVLNDQEREDVLNRVKIALKIYYGKDFNIFNVFFNAS